MRSRLRTSTATRVVQRGGVRSPVRTDGPGAGVSRPQAAGARGASAPGTGGSGPRQREAGAVLASFRDRARPFDGWPAGWATRGPGVLRQGYPTGRTGFRRASGEWTVGGDGIQDEDVGAAEPSRESYFGVILRSPNRGRRSSRAREVARPSPGRGAPVRAWREG